jgi:hypothetical protein
MEEYYGARVIEDLDVVADWDAYEDIYSEDDE